MWKISHVFVIRTSRNPETDAKSATIGLYWVSQGHISRMTSENQDEMLDVVICWLKTRMKIKNMYELDWFPKLAYLISQQAPAMLARENKAVWKSWLVKSLPENLPSDLCDDSGRKIRGIRRLLLLIYTAKAGRLNGIPVRNGHKKRGVKESLKSRHRKTCSVKKRSTTAWMVGNEMIRISNDNHVLAYSQPVPTECSLVETTRVVR